MPRTYIPSLREKYPLPADGLRQLNIRVDPPTFARLMALKEKAGDHQTVGAFTRKLFAQLLEQQTTAQQEGNH